MKPKYKWTYNLNDNDYWNNGISKTREEAIQEALKDIDLEVKDGDARRKVFYIARAFVFEMYINPDYMIEYLQEQAYDEAGEYAEDWLDNVSAEHKEMLGKRLNSLFNRWLKETGNEPKFFTCESKEEINVEEVRNDGTY